MKPYTKFQLRCVRRIATRVLCLWVTAGVIAYGLGAMKGIEERKELAAKNEAAMRERIANKTWADLLAQGEFMTGVPARRNTERN